MGRIVLPVLKLATIISLLPSGYISLKMKILVTIPITSMLKTVQVQLHFRSSLQNLSRFSCIFYLLYRSCPGSAEFSFLPPPL